jgi:hypothetical protein
LPLLLSIPLLLIGLYFFDDISIYLSQKNPIVKELFISLHWIVHGLFRNILCLGQSPYAFCLGLFY